GLPSGQRLLRLPVSLLACKNDHREMGSRPELTARTCRDQLAATSTRCKSGPISMRPSNTDAALARQSSSWPGATAGTQCVRIKVLTPALAAVPAASSTDEW